MRQSKTKYFVYAIAGAILAIIIWSVSQEMPISVEKVEEPITNNFAG